MRKFFPLLIGFLLLRIVNPSSAQEAGVKLDSALIFAAGLGHTEMVQTVLLEGADVNAKDNNGTTALMGAAFSGHTDTVKALLAKGADVKAKEQRGETALMWAARKGHTDTVKVLLAKGADAKTKRDT